MADIFQIKIEILSKNHSSKEKQKSSLVKNT